MKAVIVGAGATGCLFAALFAKSGMDVTILDRDETVIAAINESGLKYDGTGGLQRVPVKAVSTPAPKTIADLVLICVRPTDTPAAVDLLKPVVGPRTAVISMQEGVGDLPTLIERFGADRVFAASTNLVASLLDPGHVYHASWGDTKIAPAAKEQGKRAQSISNQFTKIGIKTTVVPDAAALVWTRAVIQSGYYAITTLLQVRNGKILEMPEAADLLERAVGESAAIVLAAGVALLIEQPVAEVRRLVEMTAEYNSPMLQAIYRNRPSEIEAINGAIVRLAEQNGLDAPINRTLYNIVKAFEKVRKET